MAESTVAINLGIDYQARWFWQSACRLFQPHTKVERVGYELSKFKNFDDVAIEYREPLDDRNCKGYKADYYQVKFHVDVSNALTYRNLMDPDLLDSERTVLKRLLESQRKYAPNGYEARFFFLTNWPIDPRDPLGKLVYQSSGELRLDVLFNEKARKPIREVKTAWMEHLGFTSEDELRIVLQTIRFAAGEATMRGVLDAMNQGLIIAGLVPIDADHSANIYDDLIKKQRGDGSIWFTRQDIEQICRKENLWTGCQIEEAGPAVQLGIRSFTRFTEHMENETSDMLCLNRYFDGRIPLSPDLWQTTFLPEVGRFVQRALVPGSAYHLRLDTHGSIAFAAGYFLGTKSGIEVAIPQPVATGKPAWRLNPSTLQSAEPEWVVEEIPVDTARGKDVALAISIVKDVRPEVRDYIGRALPSVCKIIEFTVLPEPGSTSVRDASHAYRLVQELIGWLPKHLNLEERRATYHIFVSAPNYFQFQLGQQASSLGCCTLYEYTFGEAVPDYSRSISIPFKLPQLFPSAVVSV